MLDRPFSTTQKYQRMNRLYRGIIIAILGMFLSFLLGTFFMHTSALAVPEIRDAAIAQVPRPPDADSSGIAIGQRNIAQEIAQTSLEEEFGAFNLFIIFFVTLGPLKVIPVFVQLTRNANRKLRSQLAFRSTAVSTIVILLVVLVGRNLLRVWQIHLPALMIAGGLLLSVVAAKLILAQYESQVQPGSSPENPEVSLAISPLAFPTILPPFGIAIALTLMIVATELGFRPIVVIGLLLLIMGLNLLCMVAARPIFKFIRPVTLRILGYTLSVMQFALGIQLILIGLQVQAVVIRLLLEN